jgi:BASS family bile acid:Na+ symporter
MLAMGATLTPRDFAEVARRPRSLVAGVLCQFGLTPLLAVLVSRVAGVGPGIAVGLILVAAMPGGSLSKFFAFFGRGNLALSVSLTVVGTLGAVVTVPLLLRLLAYGYIPDDFEVPAARVVRDIALYLLLPLWAGMVVSRLAPHGRLPFARWCVRLGFVAVVVMVVGSLGSGRIDPGEHGLRVPLAIIAFCLLSQQASMLPFRLLGWPRPDCLAVGIEVTMRNLNLALLLKALLFPAAVKGVDAIADGVLFVILFYAAAALGAVLPLALRYRLMYRQWT